MKKRKLLFLLTAVFALSVPLSACDNGESSSSSTEKETHAMATHFVLEDTRAAYSTVTRYQGTLESVNKAHGLAVLRKTEYTKDDLVKETVTVLDMASGNEMFSDSVSNPSEEEYPKTLSVDVETFYPLIEIQETTWVEDEYGYTRETTYSYHLADRYCTELVKDVAEGDNLFVDNNGKVVGMNTLASVYVYDIADTVYWIGENMELLRTFNKLQVGGYTLPDFDASYKDYLYAFEFSNDARVIEIYNREGVCSMQYTYPSDVNLPGYPIGADESEGVVYGTPVVLNNGNILVQELTLAEADATDYDFKIAFLDNQKVTMTSKIINYKTGEATEVDLDYVILGLESAYARDENDSSFPFALQAGEENQAYIAKIVNQNLAPVEYVTMDNNGSVTYTVQNEYLKLDSFLYLIGQENSDIEWSYPSMEALWDKGYYKACIVSGSLEGDSEEWLFDLDGNKVAYLPDSLMAITDDYIVTGCGIYDYTNKLVYDFETSPFFTESNAIMGASGSIVQNNTDIICLYINMETMKVELYKFDGTDFVKQEIGDDSNGIEIDYTMFFNGELPKGNKAMVTIPENPVEILVGSGIMGTCTIYKEDGEALLKLSSNDVHRMVILDDVAYLTTEIDGKDYLYVLR